MSLHFILCTYNRTLKSCDIMYMAKLLLRSATFTYACYGVRFRVVVINVFLGFLSASFYDCTVDNETLDFYRIRIANDLPDFGDDSIFDRTSGTRAYVDL